MTVALLFPTGGYLWPGMGDDLPSLERWDAAAVACGAAPGALRRLMAGEGQARRERGAAGWTWTGDYPLSMVAQLAVEAALAEAWLAHHGPPAVVAGESMGEIAALAVGGALTVEDAVALAWRWARDLQVASDRLGLRMAVVEDLDLAAVRALPPILAANVAVTEAPGLCVVALPADRLDDLEVEVTRRGGHVLVSNNHCAAHDPRLAAAADVWDDHARFLAALRFAPPRLPLLGISDRRRTTFEPVRWDATLRALPGRGARRAVLFGPPSCGYAARKLRQADPTCRCLRLTTVATLAQARPSRAEPAGSPAPRAAADLT